MPAIDMTIRRVIRAPRDIVADFATNPDNAPVWCRNIRDVDWLTARPVARGSRLSFVAIFLGRRLAYTCEVTELVPGEAMTMRADAGPMPMETRYTFEETPEGCLMTITNRGEPSGFARIAAPVLERAVRRAVTRDLGNLANLTEAMFGFPP